MAQAPTVIAANTVVSGGLQGAEDVEVLGRIQGSVQLDGHLTMGKDARIDADVVATSVEVEGILVGNVTAKGLIHLFSSAKVIGDLTAAQVVIDDGAAYRGMITMEGVEGDKASSNNPQRSAPARRTTRPTSRTSKRPAQPEPEPEPAKVEPEPALPAAAGKKKKVSAKKRK